jgi:hypothetical protein
MLLRLWLLAAAAWLLFVLSINLPDWLAWNDDGFLRRQVTLPSAIAHELILASIPVASVGGLGAALLWALKPRSVRHQP